MRIEGTVAMITLEVDRSLRIEPGTPIEISCLSGVLWVTQEGDVRDLFVAGGESLTLSARGVGVVTALERSAVRVVDRSAPDEASRPRAWLRAPALWVRGLARTRVALV
jgi:Protein of unknown function (DUF2917)